MRKLQLNVFVIILLLLSVNIVLAQKNKTDKADIQFKMKAYELAIDSYQQYLAVIQMILQLWDVWLNLMK